MTRSPLGTMQGNKCESIAFILHYGVNGHHGTWNLCFSFKAFQFLCLYLSNLNLALYIHCNSFIWSRNPKKFPPIPTICIQFLFFDFIKHLVSEQGSKSNLDRYMPKYPRFNNVSLVANTLAPKEISTVSYQIQTLTLTNYTT